MCKKFEGKGSLINLSWLPNWGRSTCSVSIEGGGDGYIIKEGGCHFIVFLKMPIKIIRFSNSKYE